MAKGKKRGADRRRDILAAVEGMVRDRRIHEITLDEVARLARVGKGTIYRHFRDKEDLFFQLTASGHEELCRLVQEMARAGAPLPFPERLRGMCARISDFFLGHRALFRLLGEHEGRLGACGRRFREAFRERRRRLGEAVACVLAEGVEAGFIRPDVPREVLAQFLLGLLRARNQAFGPDPAERPPLKLVADLFLRGAAGGPGNRKRST